METPPHYIDEEDATPGAKTDEEAGGKFVFSKEPEGKGGRPVTEGGFL